MPNIVELQVFYGAHKVGTLGNIKQAPTSQETPDIKLQVARMVKEVKSMNTEAEYYYMVVVVRKSNGELGYRTMIPKTII